MKPRWRKVVRDLTSHWFRTALVVLSIAIGIFAVGVVLGGREILLREFDRDFAASAPANVTYATADFDDEVVAEAETQAGVGGVQPRRSVMLRYTRNSDETDRTISVEAYRNYRDIAVNKVVALDEGAWPPGPDEIVLEASAKQVADYRIGDVLTLERTDGKSAELRVVGFAHDINVFPAKFGGHETGYVAFETLPALGEPEQYNRLALRFADEEISWPAASRLAADLRERLFEDERIPVFYTSIPEPGSHFLGDIFAALSLLLLAMGVLSLGLSAFLVVNTVSALMAQQVRQVGVMKAIGAGAGQIERLFTVAVLVYGVLAVAVGMPAAAAATRWFTDFAAGLLNFQVADYAPPAWVVLVEVAVGLLVPLMAAASPVRRGARMSVVRALNATGMTNPAFGHGLLDRVLGMVRGLPRPVALSLRNTFLRKGRLALTLSTLALASAVVMSVFSVNSSIERTITNLESWWRYDVQISLALPQDAAAVTEEALAVNGVEAVETAQQYGATLVRTDGTEDESFTITGLDPETDFVGPRVVEGRWLKPGDTDEIVINTDAQNADASLAVGERRTVIVRGERHTWTVVGVIEGQLGGPAVYCNAPELADVLGDEGVTRLLVRGESSDAAAEQTLLDNVESALKDAGYPVESARTRAGLADQLREWLGILVAFLVVMAVILAAVGIIGLTGTMSINVLESTREIGVMRATGAQHSAIYQIFVTEGVTVGAIAWFIGAVLAYPLSLGLVRALAEAIGIPLAYSFSWVGLVAWLALMLAISALASIAPAFRASQVSVRDAISYE